MIKKITETINNELDRSFIYRFARVFIAVFFFSLMFNLGEVKSWQELSSTLLFSTVVGSVSATFKLIRSTVPEDHPLYSFFMKFPL